MLSDALNYIENSVPAQAIATSDWLFPAIETAHVVGIAMVFGAITFVDARLIGLFRTSSFSVLARYCLPVTWAGFGVAAVTGLLMFSSAATRYVENPAFRWKMILLGLAFINMQIFHRGDYRLCLASDAEIFPLSAKAAGAISILLWVGVVAAGRWIGFL